MGAVRSAARVREQRERAALVRRRTEEWMGERVGRASGAEEKAEDRGGEETGKEGKRESKGEGKGGEEKRTLLETVLPDMMILLSEKDELVPNEQGREIWEAAGVFRRRSGHRSRSVDGASSVGEGTTAEDALRRGVQEGDENDAQDGGGLARLVVIEKALHEDAWRYRKWGVEMRRYIRDVELKAEREESEERGRRD